MSNLTQQEIEQLTNKILNEWGRELHIKLTASLAKRNLDFTGDLKDSLQQDITEARGDVAAGLQLYFESYGRVQDIRSVTYRKYPPIDAMLAYVRKVGVEKFKYVPGYPVGVIPVGHSKGKYGNGNRIAENRIAWGLARSFGDNKNKQGNRKWYAKTVWGSLDDLIEKLLGKTAALTTQEVIDSLQGK